MVFGVNLGSTTSCKISSESAYIIWRSLIDRNVSVEHLNALENYIHDQDFLKVCKDINEEYQKEIKQLTKLADAFGINGPDPFLPGQTIKSDQEVMRDQEIGEVLYRFMRLDVNMILLSLKYVPINDEVQQKMINLAQKAMYRVDAFIKYLKKKNWIFTPPEYRNTPPNVTEKVGVNEIHLLTDHLLFRYNNIRLTELFAAYAQDPDFALVLKAGVRILQKEVKLLEDRLLYFGIALPKAYPDTVPKPEKKEYFEDRFIFNTILRGMQDALALHGSAVQEIVVNDKLREFFIDLALGEINLMVKMSLYGKGRGWANLVPGYQAGE
ncbi:DUF3231 family protein [Candidatus Formimonas warabiya]|uniref:DUF3231 family protein n=1 Tax=Formimonas warabiya TaxID=1761012 RepID=A0A3G1KYI0_FORW1|nr:DUF3231 family protein [Candidatus Formimonas warabiya]ATW27447.1 hypothetical protein DCMF_24245 [Candidatus Formimonas warabiya]